ncbi:MAG TPA: ATP-binding protein [Gemmataceae bacterium]|nr:ATP-binding protein [Gemmataceae bacterium]
MERWDRLKLIVIKGADEGKQFELADPIVGIGRDPGNTVRLNDTEVSRRHAELYQKPNEGKRYYLRDVGSANGTFINNSPVNDAALQPGDQIQVGQSVLVFSGGRGDDASRGDLAEQISLITRQDVELSSAIIKSIGEGEGSRILAHPEKIQGTLANKLLTNLGILYELSQAVSHIPDLGDLLDRVLELMFRALEADRGCILVRNPDTSRFQPKAVRWRVRPPSPAEKFPVSNTIMEYVLSEKQGILVSDVMSDERFNTTQSIVRQGIREVICVPMKGRHETIGILYLDTHSTPKDFVDSAIESGLADDAMPTGKFSEDSLSLAIAIAHQAALAVEDTRYHEALVHAERLAAIGQTVAVLSHHIKNILQGLRSGGDLINMGLAGGKLDGALLQQGWKIVEKNQGKIYDLVMDMLSFSKEREPAIENVDVNAIVREVLEVVQGRAQGKNIKVTTRLSEQLPICQADPEGLNRALLNIMSNAFDAVEERRTPQVGVATELEQGGEWVRITVVDNGPGIAPDQLSILFKPFQSTKGARGTGLGLAVSRKILREHGGDILVKSELSKGSRFVLRFPVKSPFAPDVNSTNPEMPRLNL